MRRQSHLPGRRPQRGALLVQHGNDIQRAGFDFVRVKIGAHDIDAAPLDVTVAEIIGNQNYVGATFENDVALLRLSTRVDPATYRPVRLEWDPAAYVEGTPAIVMGWGTTAQGSLANTLRQAEVPPSARRVRRARVVSGPAGEFAHRHGRDALRRISRGRHGRVQGDSGGPLIVAAGGAANRKSASSAGAKGARSLENMACTRTFARFADSSYVTCRTYGRTVHFRWTRNHRVRMSRHPRIGSRDRDRERARIPRLGDRGEAKKNIAVSFSRRERERGGRETRRSAG